jgi:hypothetical protein
VSTFTALAGFALGIAAVFYYLSDPDRPIKAIERRLAKGETVTLIGDNGAPRWSRGAMRAKTLLASDAPDKPFSLSSFDFAPLELLPHPPARGYRFRAEVRHDDVHVQGRTGIFFGLAPWGAEGHCWCELGFDDRKLSRRPPPPPAGAPKAPERSRIVLRIHTVEDAEGKRNREILCPNTDDWFDPDGARVPGARPWRSVAADVTPDKVTVLWEGRPVGEVTWATLRRPGSFLPPGTPGAADEYPLAPQGGLGVYVSRGVASFRQVVIEPLP